MKSERLKVVRGSGNVFRDLGHKNADAGEFKAILAAEIIKALDREGLSVRRMGVQELRQPTSRVSAMPILEGSLSIALCPSSTGSARG
jgi:hypothetical protein